MSSYPQIANHLRKFEQAQSKLTQIELNKDSLEALVDFQKIEDIQEAVQKRMGPLMCDNTEEQSKIEKNAYLRVLQNYQRQLEASTASQQQQYAKMKTSLLDKSQSLSERLESRLAQWESLRNRLKSQCLEATHHDSLAKISLRTQTMQMSIHQKLNQFSEELSIAFLQQQLRRRKIIDEMLQISRL